MLNLNLLYKAVFKPEYQRFDPTKNYYTIFLDTPSFAPLYPEFNDRIEYLLSADSYSYLHASENAALERNEVEEKLSEIAEMLDMRTNSAPPARRFCLISYFDDENQDVQAVARQISWLECDSRDVVTLLVCLSKRMSGKAELLENLVGALGEKAKTVDMYVFTDAHTVYYRRALINSLCGAVVLNSEVAQYQTHKQRKYAAAVSVGKYIDSLGDDGRRYLSTKKPMLWSSLYCKYYDRKLDFLHQYTMETCENVKKLTQEDFIGFANEVYNSLVPHREKGAVKTTISRAVEMIPYVVPGKPKQALSSLRSYLQYLYGDRGVGAVDLTLKATLSGIYNYRIEDLGDKGCLRLMELCSGYAMPDWELQVKAMLDTYIRSLRDAVSNAQASLEKLLDDDLMGDEEGTMDRYLNQFQRYYEAQKILLFFDEVSRKLHAYPERYDHFSRRSEELAQQMELLRQSIPTGRVYQYEKLPVPALSAEQMLTIDQSEALCASIRALFNSQQDNNTGVTAPTDCGPVFAVVLDPQFSRTASVELHTAAYTFCGCEMNGLYFVSMEGEQDV